MWYWRKMENINWTDCVRNDEILHGVKDDRNILHTVIRRKFNWIGLIWRRNCLLKHISEGKIEKRIEVAGKTRSKT
jgi:hypothetical protein